LSAFQIKTKKGEEVNYLTLNGTVEQINATKEALTEQLAKIVEKNFTNEFIQTLRDRMSAKFDCCIDYSRKSGPDKVIICRKMRWLRKTAF